MNGQNIKIGKSVNIGFEVKKYLLSLRIFENGLYYLKSVEGNL